MPSPLAPPISDDLALAQANMLELVEEARRSPIGLYKLLFTDEAGRPIVIKWFHEEWNELYLKHRIFMICASRELTKTSMMLAAVAWIIGRNPNLRIGWISADDKTATKRLAVIHGIIDSPLYQMVFPGVRKLTPKEAQEEKRPNSATVLNVKRDFRAVEPTVEACGILSSGTGGRHDLLAVDDPVSESNSLLNPSLRPKIISKFVSDWLGTLVADGRVWYVGSPWHRDDLLGYLKRTAGWLYREYKHGKWQGPNCVDQYHSIFPERWPRAALIERRRTFGAAHYARAYLCQAFTDDTVAIRPQALLPYTTEMLTPEKLYEQTIAVVAFDSSSGKNLEKGRLDYTGVCVFLIRPPMVKHDEDEDDDDDAVAKQREHERLMVQVPFEIFVVEAFQIKLPHVLQAKLAWQLIRKWDADHFVCDAEGMQSLHAWLENERIQDPTLPLAEIHPVLSGNMNKGQRLVRISPLLERPEGELPVVYLSEHLLEPSPQATTLRVGEMQYEILHDLYNQIVNFPTAHDDILDAFTSGLHWSHTNLIGLPGEELDRDQDQISMISL